MDEKFLKELFKNNSRAIVGKLCKHIELLQNKKDLSENQKFRILKDFNRELIYQEFRNIIIQVKAYNSGLKFRKFNVAPSSQQKKVV